MVISKRRSVCVFLIFIFALGVLILPNLVRGYSSYTSIRQEAPLQGSQVEILHALEVQLNAHNVDGALAFFAENASVYDPTTISCYGGTGFLCEPSELISSYTSKAQIRGWLEYLAQVNLEVQEIGVPKIIGNNVTWSWQVSNDGYRELNVAPLVGTGEAVINGNLIQYLSFRLNTDSVRALRAALALYSRSPFFLAAESIAVGLVALGLVFPGVAVYYVTRVKQLFATVPKLDKPWILLGACLGSIFVSVLLVALREFAGVSPNIIDPFFDGAVSFSSISVMSAVILMKRVMLGEAHE